MKNSAQKEVVIGVIGLGYVGLPLARLFSTRFPVVGFDIHAGRVEALRRGEDHTLEVSGDLLREVLLPEPPLPSSGTGKGLYCTADPEDLRICNFYVVTVPTPVDKNHRPDLNPLIKASETVGRVIAEGDLVVYESTVYPGATEEDCIPVIERVSGLKFNQQFFAGYSPERINPGDREHTVEKIRKVVSGSTPEATLLIEEVYGSVIQAGTFRAASIRVAEAAKVIENSQRDINIAFVNELSKIFACLGLDTLEVLEAAGTKWNFLPFRPGLVGGHCIGVDPYYLAQKAQEVGYHPEIILAGRRLNDGMGRHVANRLVRLMIGRDIPVKGSRVLMLGITFKENCPDIRNTRAVDVYHELKSYGVAVDVFDPWAHPDEVRQAYGIDILTRYPEKNGYDALILTVAHKAFENIDLLPHKQQGAILYDVKGVLPVDLVDERL